MSNKAASGSFPPILGILGLIFVTLKLAGIGVVATWSWWLILSPFWIPIGVVMGLLLIAGVIAAFSSKR